MVDTVTEAHCFCCNRRTVSRLVFRQGFYGISSCMRSVAASFCADHSVVCIVTVTYQKAFKPFEKLSWMNAYSRLLVLKNNDAAVIHFTVAIDPHSRVGRSFPVLTTTRHNTVAVDCIAIKSLINFTSLFYHSSTTTLS